IVAVLTRPDGRPMPAPGEVLAALDAAVAVPLPSGASPDAVGAVARHVQAADRLLRGVAGVSLLAARRDVRAAVAARPDPPDGRDSAGVHLMVRDHGLDMTAPAVQALVAPRAADPLFTSRSVRITPEGALSFVYKAAAEIGELGDNTAAIRAAIADDDVLRLA